MPTQTRRLTALIALITLGLSSGLHVAAIQGFAWTRMYSEYQKTMPAAEAIELTFSGRDLCGICVAVDEIQSNMDDIFLSYHNASIPLLLPLATNESLLKTSAPQRENFLPERRLPPPSALTSTQAPPPRTRVA